MIRLTLLTRMTANVASIASTRRTPLGTRQNYITSGGTLEGRLSGKVHEGGGDYLLVDEAGVGHVDARLTWELDDGAHVYVQYLGKVILNDLMAEALKSGGETQFGETYFMTQLRFEAGHVKYAWLNSAVAIAEGRVAKGGAIQYNVYLCEADQMATADRSRDGEMSAALPPSELAASLAGSASG